MNKAFAVETKNLTVKFDDFVAVNDISFSVSRGEIFGFLGANGAGKTTTIRVLCGLMHPSAGSVLVAGIPFLNVDNEMDIKRKVGYMSQKFTLYNDLTVEENFQFIASLRNLSRQYYSKRRDFILDFINFQYPLNAFVQDLPGGIKQQVSLAAAILHDPEIVFLDEPTAGVTPAMRKRFWALINNLASLNKTLFVTTHYMDEAENCNRIALMREGKIIALDTPSRLKETTFTDQVYEFSPKTDINYAEITEMQQNREFAFFEPYGLRFHVVFKNPKETEKLKKEFGQYFDIIAITPTLEDVFIKMIEGKKT